eukprot:scaffold1105_cov140-Isochrysis_galbana.AAC.15
MSTSFSSSWSCRGAIDRCPPRARGVLFSTKNIISLGRVQRQPHCRVLLCECFANVGWCSELHRPTGLAPPVLIAQQPHLGRHRAAALAVRLTGCGVLLGSRERRRPANTHGAPCGEGRTHIVHVATAGPVGGHMELRGLRLDAERWCRRPRVEEDHDALPVRLGRDGCALGKWGEPPVRRGGHRVDKAAVETKQPAPNRRHDRERPLVCLRAAAVSGGSRPPRRKL